MKNQKTLIILILLLCIPMNTETEEVFIEEKVVLSNEMGKVYGSLLVPNITSETVALIISGSGPTDRDGNLQFYPFWGSWGRKNYKFSLLFFCRKKV